MQEPKITRRDVVLKMLAQHEKITKDRISAYEYFKSIGVIKGVALEPIRGKEKIAKDA